MDGLVRALKKLADRIRLERYDWGIPEKCPIRIPASVKGGFSRNIFLKDNLHGTLLRDKSLNSHYWVIRDWGRIGSFKRNPGNDRRIKKFLARLKKGTLTRAHFDRISSLSKVASFAYPDDYAIYDSRAIYALNWLLFNHTRVPELYPQPIGRNAVLSEFDLGTIFRLSGRSPGYLSHKLAYHRYCELLKHLTPKVFGKGHRPYRTEMLLFMAAPSAILDQVKASVSLKIEISA